MNHYNLAMSERTIQELRKLGSTPREIADATGFTPCSIRQYLNGGIPSTPAMKTLYDAGVDIMYIITGERIKK